MSIFIQCFYRVTGVTLALLWLFQSTAVAGIYKWKDEQGKLHYTDDRAKIPLKYRESVQKFKGVTELKPKEEVPPEEEQEEPKSEKETSAAVEPPPEEKPKASPLPPLTEEEKATMTAVYRPLLNLWNSHVLLLMEGEPEEKKLKQYVAVAKKSAASKKSIGKTIGKSENALLVEIKAFLKKSRKKDVRLREDDPALMSRAKIYTKRLMKEVPVENGFLKKLHQRLELKTPSPLIDLEEALKVAAKKRERIKKMNEEKRNPPQESSDGTRF